jgi:hypothetical protein
MNAFSPLSKLVFDDPITLDAADHMFNMHSDATYPTIFFFFFLRQLSTTRLFLRLEDRDTFWPEALKSCVLPQDTPWREVIAFTVCDPLVMPFPFPCSTQTANTPEAISNQNSLDSVLPLLSTIMQELFIWVRRSIYWSFSSIMEKKGWSWMSRASVSEASSVSSASM